MENLPVERQHIVALVEAFKRAKLEIRQAYESLRNASNLLNPHIQYYELIRDRFRTDDLEYEWKYICRSLKKSAWETIVRKLQIQNLCASKRWEEMEKQIKEDKLPEIEIENIYQIVSGFAGNINQLIEESIKETFEWLRPHFNKYKTNSEYEIGTKIIQKCIVDTSYNLVRFNSYREQHIKSLDNTFHLLDGKGPIQYPGDLLTKIRDAIQKNEWECSTEYFRCKWYKKGTMHIEILREDLLKKLNEIAGGNRLKPNMSPKDDIPEDIKEMLKDL